MGKDIGIGIIELEVGQTKIKNEGAFGNGKTAVNGTRISEISFMCCGAGINEWIELAYMCKVR